jgi:hypothetical protein
MMHGPQNIKDTNVNKENCCCRHLHPLSLIFEYVFVGVCLQELFRVVLCAHRSIIEVNVVKALAPDPFAICGQMKL